MNHSLSDSSQSLTSDLIIIGGGILGAAVARDAALRGLRVTLVEAADFGSGTSAASTRLIHGGLRYLEHLDFGLVRQDLAERERLLQLAPHLVRPLPFLIPIYRRGLPYRLKLRLGLTLYDLLSFDRSLPGHRFLSAAAALQAEPGLAADGLEGAAVYYDAQVELTERLCIEQIVEATAHGALALNHCRVTGLLRDERGAVVGVTAHDELATRALTLRAPVVVNATGPWLDELLALVQPGHTPLLRRTKGIHVVAPAVAEQAIVLFAERDSRLFFIIPWRGYAFVGTTDTDFVGDPAAAQAEPAEIDYLLAEVRRAFPTAPWRPLYYTTAGVRALVRREDVTTGAVSRKHRLLDHGPRGLPGLLSIVGGKLTAHRDIAEETVDLVTRRLGRERPCLTRQRPLPGAVGYGPTTLSQAITAGAALGLAEDQSRLLVTVYGSRYRELLELIATEPRLAERIDPASPDCLAQLRHAVEREGARTLDDALRRRLTLGLGADQGRRAAPRAAAELARWLGWDAARTAVELDRYRAIIDRQRAPLEGAHSLPFGEPSSVIAARD